MNKLDKRAELIKRVHEELDRRTAVENEAAKLMREGEYEEATRLLASLDDSIIKSISEELDRMDETEGADSIQQEVEDVNKKREDYRNKREHINKIKNELTLQAVQTAFDNGFSMYDIENLAASITCLAKCQILKDNTLVTEDLPRNWRF